MKPIKVLLPIFFFLFLSACGGKNALSAEPAPVSTPAIAPKEQLAQACADYRVEVQSAESNEDIYAMLCEAWEVGNTGSGIAESKEHPEMVLKGDRLYMLRGTRVMILSLSEGQLTLIDSVSVGEEWTALTEETQWSGGEKILTALYATDTRLAVISDCVEYSADEQNFRDESYTAVDVYDISGEAMTHIGAFGQSGYFAHAELSGEILCLVTHQELAEEECADENYETLLPTLYSEEERRTLENAEPLLLSDSPSADYIIISAIDLNNTEPLNSKAVFGRCVATEKIGDELALFFERNLLLEVETEADGEMRTYERLYADETDVLTFSLKNAELQDSHTLEGRILSTAAEENLYILLTESRSYTTVVKDEKGCTIEEKEGESHKNLVCRAYDGNFAEAQALTIPAEGKAVSKVIKESENFRILFDDNEILYTYVNFTSNNYRELTLLDEWSPVWLAEWDENQAAALLESTDGSNPILAILDISGDSASIVTSIKLGYDFLPSAQVSAEFDLFPEFGIIGLSALDGYALYALDENSRLSHLTDSYSYGGETGAFAAEGMLFLYSPYGISVWNGVTHQQLSEMSF